MSAAWHKRLKQFFILSSLLFLQACAAPQAEISLSAEQPSIPVEEKSKEKPNAEQVHGACVYSEAQALACSARGKDYQYGAEIYVYCSGVPPEPLSTEMVESLSKQSCVCNFMPPIVARQQMCWSVP